MHFQVAKKTHINKYIWYEGDGMERGEGRGWAYLDKSIHNPFDIFGSIREQKLIDISNIPIDLETIEIICLQISDNITDKLASLVTIVGDLEKTQRTITKRSDRKHYFQVCIHLL